MDGAIQIISGLLRGCGLERHGCCDCAMCRCGARCALQASLVGAGAPTRDLDRGRRFRRGE